ncbi:MAG: MBL fold metallo-hydrolase, partial [Candidatus Aminicenantes bacterium]
MAIQELKTGIYSLGANDWDRRLFDELIPLPDGTSYNSYLVKGSEKIAVIDSVDPPKSEEWLANIKKLGAASVDYIISNHAEQDHSGAIPDLLELYPEAKVVTNEKCKAFLEDLLLIPSQRFFTIRDGEVLSLGDRTLEFVFTPWVHWPETLCTYLREDRILFSCDFFGSHLATSDLFVKNAPKVIEDAKRYFAEIMMPFRVAIGKNIRKIEALDIAYIAPSHGP